MPQMGNPMGNMEGDIEGDPDYLVAWSQSDWLNPSYDCLMMRLPPLALASFSMLTVLPYSLAPR